MIKNLQKLLSARGFSMVEGIMGAGLMGAVALGAAELAKNNASSTANLESRYAKMDVEQSIRSSFMSSDSCKCVFAGKTITAGSSTALSDVKFMDASCGNARMIVESGKNIQNSTLKVENIAVTNISSLSATEAVGDLVINWKPAGKNLPIKPSMMKNLRFSVDSSNAVMGCGFMPEKAEPEECGYGKICISGKQVQFFNDPAYGAPMSAVNQGIDTDGWLTVELKAPSGRFTMLKFKEIAGILKYMVPHGNWRPQLCWYHFLADPCQFFSGLGANCGSAIHWKYFDGVSSTPQPGNTGVAALRVTNPSPGSPEKPFVSCP